LISYSSKTLPACLKRDRNCFLPGWEQGQSRTGGRQLWLRGKPLYLSLLWVEVNKNICFHQKRNTAHLQECQEAGQRIALFAPLPQTSCPHSLPSATPDPHSDPELWVFSCFIPWAGRTVALQLLPGSISPPPHLGVHVCSCSLPLLQTRCSAVTCLP